MLVLTLSSGIQTSQWKVSFTSTAKNQKFDPGKGHKDKWHVCEEIL